MIPPDTMKALANRDQRQLVCDEDLKREAALGRVKDLSYKHFKAQEKENAA